MFVLVHVERIDPLTVKKMSDRSGSQSVTHGLTECGRKMSVSGGHHLLARRKNDGGLFPTNHTKVMTEGEQLGHTAEKR